MKEVDGWQDLEGESTTIDKFKYDAASNTLAVIFKAGGLYNYLDVPEEVAKDFLVSESKGKFLSKSIRGTYKYAKIEIEPVGGKLLTLEALQKIAEKDDLVAALIKSKGIL